MPAVIIGVVFVLKPLLKLAVLSDVIARELALYLGQLSGVRLRRIIYIEDFGASMRSVNRSQQIYPPWESLRTVGNLRFMRI